MEPKHIRIGTDVQTFDELQQAVLDALEEGRDLVVDTKGQVIAFPVQPEAPVLRPRLFPGVCELCDQKVRERHYTEAADGAAAMHCRDCTTPRGRDVFHLPPRK